MAKDKLEPCPFCGGEASDAGHIKYNHTLPDTWWEDGSPIKEAFYVNCMRCGAVSRSGIVAGYQTKAEAITAWNQRTRPTVSVDVARIREIIRENEGDLDLAGEEVFEYISSLSHLPQQPAAPDLVEAAKLYDDALDIMFDGPDESDRDMARTKWRLARQAALAQRGDA